jgi:hypothetical protein
MHWGRIDGGGDDTSSGFSLTLVEGYLYNALGKF